ncbi:MAG: DUF4382 domain-containing protein [Candidatus Atribacteria bacterium]|nr:MAG: DUF4382 domain-containing protein [Candidatus Atribacteria bacterium]
MKKIIFSLALILLVIVGCSDNSTDPSQGNGTLKLYLVDSPSSFDSVIVFVKQVDVHKSGSDSTSGWFVINNTLRRFDLLELRNGASAVLGDSVLGSGKYTQIRLILADGNYVIDNGIKHNLTVTSGMQTGIKLNHEFMIEPNNLYELLLDFNVDKSIHITGNGKYMMKPVIRVMPMITSGTISGQVLPLDAQATVFTTIGSDTVSTYPDVDGFFKLMALPQRVYDVTIFPDTTVYKYSVITGVNVSANQNTDIGTITLENK